MTYRTYYAGVSVQLADEFEDWRPMQDLADDIKIVKHTDGRCEILLRRRDGESDGLATDLPR